MNISLLKVRLAKLAASLLRPGCWRALSRGVAPAIEHLHLLRQLNVDGVIDVGANRGQFSLACRIAMPRVPVLAFEPIPGEANTYEAIHGRDPLTTLVRTALGDSRSEATLHLSQSADSSSLLPIGKRQTELFPNTGEVGTLTVKVQPLDDLLPLMAGRDRQLLKLDVQGYELQVLKGAVQTLAKCTHVYAECSEVALYDGQSLRPAITAFLGERGFRESGSYNHQSDGDELVQADYLYSRE